MTTIINRKYEYIVLDIDGTLVHTQKRNKGNGIPITFDDSHGDVCNLWVHKRPGFDSFILKCSENSKVGVWSMGQPGYVDAVVKLFPMKPDFVYNWLDCDRDSKRVYKKLSNIPCNNRSLMIDDDNSILMPHGIIDIAIVSKWNTGLKTDRVLIDLPTTIL